MPESKCPANHVHDNENASRRAVLIGGVSAVAALATVSHPSIAAAADATDSVDIRKADTAVVFIDPQNDVLSEKGANWAAVGASVKANGTVENIWP